MIAGQIRRVAWLISAAVLGGCHPAPIRPSPLALSIDSAAFHRRGQSPVLVPFSIANTGPATLYVRQCEGHPMPELDRWSLGAWRFSDGNYCNGSPPSLLSLSPGSSLQGAITVYDGGAYRLRVNAANAGGETVPHTEASRDFNVW
jgi:hypothetical protein